MSLFFTLSLSHSFSLSLRYLCFVFRDIFTHYVYVIKKDARQRERERETTTSFRTVVYTHVYTHHTVLFFPREEEEEEEEEDQKRDFEQLREFCAFFGFSNRERERERERERDFGGVCLTER